MLKAKGDGYGWAKKEVVQVDSLAAPPPSPQKKMCRQSGQRDILFGPTVAHYIFYPPCNMKSISEICAASILVAEPICYFSSISVS